MGKRMTVMQSTIDTSPRTAATIQRMAPTRPRRILTTPRSSRTARARRDPDLERSLRTPSCATRSCQQGTRFCWHIRLLAWIVGQVSSLRRQQPTEGTQVDVEVLGGKPIPALQVLHRLFQMHQPEPEALDLLFGEVPLVKPAQRLGFHELANQFDYRQDQLEKVPLDGLRIGLEPLRKTPGLLRHDPLPIAPCPPGPRRSRRAT